jgi:hypothetical protein
MGSSVVVRGSEGRVRVKDIEFQWNYAPNQAFPVSTEVSNVDLEGLREDLQGGGMNRSEGDTSVNHRNIKRRRSGRSGMGGKHHGSAVGTAVGHVPELCEYYRAINPESSMLPC